MRALIISDIHGNLEALEAVLAAAGPCDAVWNLGDTVGYGASPNEVVERVRVLASAGVRGNHDRVCCGLANPVYFNPVAREAALWTRNQLSASATEWLRDQPAGPVTAGAVALSHGSPLHEDQYLLTVREAMLPLQSAEAACTFFGHTHIQGGFGWEGGKPLHLRPTQTRHPLRSSSWTLPLRPDARYLLNPGSVGQPRDDDPRAAYAILDTGADAVTFFREPYDVDLAAGRILLAGLPERLAQRLHSGR